ncbi:MAG: flavodoxin [Eubacteriales bacterium]|nr:flavodoxin [Eubacteriales bacterium]
MKAAVIYWSGTGNTEAMANAVAEGMKSAGAEVAMYTPADVDASTVSSCSAVAFGCPAMGAEVLEEAEFQPMWDDIKAQLTGKRVALFGSYGWGDGEWMRSWEADANDAGVNLAAESVMANNAPDDAAIEACKAMGAAIAG